MREKKEAEQGRDVALPRITASQHRKEEKTALVVSERRIFPKSHFGKIELWKKHSRQTRESEHRLGARVKETHQKAKG